MPQDKRPGAEGTTEEHDPFTTDGREVLSPEKWSIKEAAVGDGIAGRFVEFRKQAGKKGDAYTVAVISPALVRKGKEYTGYKSMAINLSSMLEQRISPTADKGKIFSVVMKGWEGKGADAYAVLSTHELSDKVFAELLRVSGAAELIDREDLPF